MEDPVQPAAIDPVDPVATSETVGFLRRLASMIAVGQNAANLNHAAILIETLMRRATEAERSYADQQAVTATYADMCKAYEVMLDRQRAETASLEARLVRLSDETAAERARLVAETERLSTLLEQALSERAAATESLADLTTRFASLGESSVIVSVAALQAMRAQFDSLAEEFAKHGDVVALAMSDAGRCTVERLLSDARPEPEAASTPTIG
jgi:hypothetical protein